MTALTDYLCPGIVLPYVGATAPVGWLLCDGSALAADTEHQALRALLVAGGSPFGSSGGNPRLPNLGGRFPLGAGDGWTVGSSASGFEYEIAEENLPVHTHAAGTLSAVSGGAHTHGQGSLTTNSTGSHTHTSGTLAASTDPGHTHTFPLRQNSQSGAGWAEYSGDSTGSASSSTTNSGGSHTHTISGEVSTAGAHAHAVSGTVEEGGAHTHTLTGSTASTGDAVPLTVIPPHCVLNYIIKT